MKRLSCFETLEFGLLTVWSGCYRYKGMAAGGPGSGAQSPRKSVSPQSTGFSQIQARNLGEGGGGQQMSVLLNWHEKLVELTGTGSIVRVMTDRRTV